MSIQVGSNFKYRGPLPNFERDKYETLDKMKDITPGDMDNGHLAFCIEDGKTYRFNSANDHDDFTGYWREFGESELDKVESVNLLKREW